MHKKSSPTQNIGWEKAVDEALCFGWIDSTKKTIDEQTFKQYFGKRKPTSTWSRINKIKVADFIEKGLMFPAGLKTIEVAKKNGSWTILDTVEALIIPEDLDRAFQSYSGSKAYFLSLSKSARKILLSWIVMAKRPETRQKRILEVAESAGEGRKPKQF